MRQKLAFMVLICALVPIAFGCARGRATTTAESDGTAEVSTGIPLAPDFRIDDIPVPAGFEFDRKNSFVFQNNKIDVGKIQYAGGEEIGAVGQFYLDEMPRYNWSLITVTEHATIVMFFEKPTKHCTVLLTPKTRGTLIQISFNPKAVQPEAAN